MTTSTSEPPIARERPDIILIHCHDLGDWLSVYGRAGIDDPNISRFASGSQLFDNAFATSPLCTPARSSMFTGLLPHQNGLMGLTHAGWQYAPGVKTLPEMLASAGYRTALLGLQHEDLDARKLGYDEVHGLGFLPRALEVVKMAKGWLADHELCPEPYFAAIGFWEVHRPWPHEDYEPANPDEVDVPPYLPDNEFTRRDIADFYGSIRQLDEAMGQLLDEIDSTDRGRNSLIVFTTDHGVAFPRAKSTLYDSGVKVAFMVRPPASWGVRPGRSSRMASHLDIVPTLVELAGGCVPDELEGLSLLPTILGEGCAAEHDALIFEKTYHDRYDPIRAIRTGSAKYIRNFAEGPRLPLPLDLEMSTSRAGLGDAHLSPRPTEELYLLNTDPWELDNVAADPAVDGLKAELAARLDAHMRQTGDPILEATIAPPPAPIRD